MIGKGNSNSKFMFLTGYLEALVLLEETCPVRITGDVISLVLCSTRVETLEGRWDGTWLVIDTGLG